MKKNSDIKKAVIYARFSSHSQNEQSIEGQLKDCYAFAEKEGIKVIGEYIDRAKSARTADRPDFQRMIKDASKRLFDYIIVWKLDRFTRNRYDSAIFKAKLKKYGVKVLSAMENISDSPEGIILEGLLEAMAEYYSANLSENIIRGQRETIEKGKFTGGTVPYGYKSEDGKLIINERTAPIVRYVFDEYAEGVPMKTIIDTLTAKGVKSPRGKKLSYTSYSAMLRNPVYIGNLMRNGQVVEDCAERMISDEVFDKVQRLLETRKRRPSTAKATERYQLYGKAFCGLCGANLVGESGTSRNGKVYNYYTSACRQSPSVSAGIFYFHARKGQ